MGVKAESMSTDAVPPRERAGLWSDWIARLFQGQIDPAARSGADPSLPADCFPLATSPDSPAIARIPRFR